MSKGLFITAIGTDIGKTYVTFFGYFDVYIGHGDDLLVFFFHYSIFCLQTARFYAIISAVKFTDAQ